MESIELAVLVIGGSTLFAILGLVFVRKKYGVERLHAHHEVGGYLFSILGTLYAVVLGFVVVNASEMVHQAKSDIGLEVNAMMNIYRLSDAISPKGKDEIEKACKEYCYAVAEEEWPAMSRGHVSRRAWTGMNHVWLAIKSIEPKSQQEQCIYDSILDNYKDMSNGRRLRLMAANGTISPILWLVLVSGGIITIGFSYFFAVDRLKTQVVMTALVAIVLSLNMFLIVVNNNPFSGDLAIGSRVFQVCAKYLEDKGLQPPDPKFMR